MAAPKCAIRTPKLEGARQVAQQGASSWEAEDAEQSCGENVRQADATANVESSLGTGESELQFVLSDRCGSPSCFEDSTGRRP